MTIWGGSKKLGFVGALALAGLIAALVAAPAGAAPTLLPTTSLSAPGQNANFPIVAMDEAGDSVAVWERFDGSAWIVEASNRAVAGDWSVPVKLSAPGQNAETPQVTMDREGDSLAAWKRFDGADFIIEVAVRPAGGSWSAPVKLSAAGETAENPRVAMDAAGDAITTWKRDNGTNLIVEAASRPAGDSWSAPVPISAPGRNAEAPRVAIGAGGRAVVAFGRYNSSVESVVEASVFTFGQGSWTAPVPISSPEGEFPDVAVDPAGDAVVAWERPDGANYRIEASTLAAVGGGWSAAVPISAAGRNASSARVAIDATGEAVATWKREDGTNFLIEAASHPLGGAWGTPVALSAPGQEAEAARVAIDAAGDATVEWTRSDGAHYIIEMARRTASGGWGSATPLSVPGENALEPSVAMDDGGDAILSWSRTDGSNAIVQVAAVDGAGPLLRGLAIPPAGLVGQSLPFSVAPIDAFSALGATTWSFGDGTTASGAAITHVFANAGTYTVTLTSADALGNLSTTTRTVAVTQGLAKALRGVKVKGKFAQVKLSCPTAGTCAGRLSLTARLPVAKVKSKGAKAPKVKKRKPRSVTIGAAPFSLASGATATVAVRLSGKALAALARKRSLLATLAGTGLQSSTVKLTAPKKKHRRGGHHSHR
jgi:hypothetical protein